jgi:predicted RNA-binding Zn-ribbon protein involved in translation (DUF1610 family)
VPDFITLSCPSCGGKLEITKDIERFACAHCGMEHLVKRTSNIVTLAPIEKAVKCPNCGRDNPDSTRFCSGCAQPLLKECPSCKAWNKLDAEHCGSCGQRYRASADRAAAIVSNEVGYRKYMRYLVIVGLAFVLTVALHFLANTAYRSVRISADRQWEQLDSGMKWTVQNTDEQYGNSQARHYRELRDTSNRLQIASRVMLYIELIPFSLLLVTLYFILFHWFTIRLLSRYRGSSIDIVAIQLQATGLSRRIWTSIAAMTFVVVLFAYFGLKLGYFLVAPMVSSGIAIVTGLVLMLAHLKIFARS